MFDSKWIIAVVLLVAAVLAGVGLYSDLPSLARLIGSFPLTHLFGTLALSLANFALRYLRWEFYLRLLDIKLRRSTSILVFAAGLGMSITPGKVGEVAKCYLVKDIAGTPIARSGPVVLMERVMDFLAVAGLSLLGLTLFPYGPVLVVVGIALTAVATLLILTHRKGTFPVSLVSTVGRWRQFLMSSRNSLRRLLAARPFVIALALSLLAWLSQGFGMWVVLRGLGSSLGYFPSISVYSTATLIGGLSMLPGGLGSTEASLIGLLRGLSVPADVASAATLLVRFCTLWFAVAVGVVALVVLRRTGSAALSDAPVAKLAD